MSERENSIECNEAMKRILKDFVQCGEFTGIDIV